MVTDLFYWLIIGSLAVCAFAIGIVLFVVITGEVLKNKFKGLVDESNIILQGGANCFVNYEAVGGWMVLTVDKLIFLPHTINYQKNKIIINISDIVNVARKNTMGIVPNGISVITKDKTTYNFVVSHRNKWIENIKRTLK